MDGEQLTDWDADVAAVEFEQFDAALWWRLGYNSLPSLLGLRQCGHEPWMLLDLGCGTGRVGNWVARQWGVPVVGVDPSSAMIRTAHHRAAPGARYLHRLGQCTGLPAASVDAAWAAFVAVCLPDLATLRQVAVELARVVRPGGRVVLLDSHPETTGVDFGDVVQGKPGVAYQPGDSLPVWLRRRDGTWAPITDTYWSLSTYTQVLTDVGFDNIEHHAPLLHRPADRRATDLVPAEHRRRWCAAETQPPFLLVRAQRRVASTSAIQRGGFGE